MARGISAPQLRVAAFSHAVARLRGARFAKYRSQVLGSRVVVQVRRTWWLATPRGFSPSACRANPKPRRIRAITRPAELAADSCQVTAKGTDFFPLCAAKMTAIASGSSLLKPNVKNLSGEGHFCYFSLAPCRMRIAVCAPSHCGRRYRGSRVARRGRSARARVQRRGSVRTLRARPTECVPLLYMNVGQTRTDGC